MTRGLLPCGLYMAETSEQLMTSRDDIGASTPSHTGAVCRSMRFCRCYGKRHKQTSCKSTGPFAERWSTFATPSKTVRSCRQKTRSSLEWLWRTQTVGEKAIARSWIHLWTQGMLASNARYILHATFRMFSSRVLIVCQHLLRIVRVIIMKTWQYRSSTTKRITWMLFTFLCVFKPHISAICLKDAAVTM